MAVTKNVSRSTLVTCDMCEEQITEVPFSTQEIVDSTVEWAINEHKTRVHNVDEGSREAS